MRYCKGLAIAILLILLVGCTDESAFVKVRLSVQKGIEATPMDSVSYYTYSARRTSDYPTEQGKIENQILLIKDGVAEIGYLTQGRWTFTVQAWSSRDTLLYEGSNTVYVGTSDIDVPIVLTQHQGEFGFVHLEITTLKIAEKAPSLVAIWKSYDESKSGSNALWTVTDNGTYWTYKGDFTVEEDRYLLTLSVFSTTKDASSVTDMMVVGSDTTYITGYLNPGSDVQGYILLQGPNEVKGVIECSSSIEPNKACTFTWKNLGCKVINYVWTVDGVVQSSTKSTMSFTPKDWGNYTIVCTASNEDGETGYAVYTVGANGTSWTVFGQALLKDNGESYGTYTFSQDGTMCMRLSGKGGRYLAFGGTLSGQGTQGEPYITWAPYIEGKEVTSTIGTTSTSSSANTALILSKDSSGEAHSNSSNYYVSLGGAFSKIQEEGLYLPCYEETLLIVTAINEGRITIEDGTYWTSTESGSSAWVMVVTKGSATMSKLIKTSKASLMYVRLI